LERRADGSIDVIICDLSDPLDGGPCYQLYTTTFYEMCKTKLAPGGILVTQSGCAAVRDCHHVFTPIHKTLKTVFPQCWGYTVCVPSFCSEWGFNVVRKEADALSVEDGLSGGKLDARLKERGLGDLSYYDEITHRRMFSLNRTVREACRDETRVMTVENPLFMCSTTTHQGVFEDK
jgi:spermidine synthase